MTVNAPAPVATATDFATGTTLTVDMGQNGITTQAGPPGSAVNPGAISFFTAQRNIQIGSSGENVDILSQYQTLLQGASLQSIVYFQQISEANPGTRVNVVPNTLNSAGALTDTATFLQPRAPLWMSTLGLEPTPCSFG